MKNRLYWWVVLLAMSLLVACGGEKQLNAAPAGDRAVLEQLAKAYRQASQQYPMQPQAMAPKGRKEFVSRVFAQAGYSYSATLLAMAGAEADASNQNQRDLVDLLLLPIKGLPDKALEKLYTADELAAVQVLREKFR